MKKTFILLIASIFITAYYCGQAFAAIGGDDDDGPIIMELIRNLYNMPVSGAVVIFVQGEDTVINQTDLSGTCVSRLKNYGEYSLTVVHPDYAPLTTFISVEQPEQLRIDTLIK